MVQTYNTNSLEAQTERRVKFKKGKTFQLLTIGVVYIFKALPPIHLEAGS